jgi:hypothetical protein
MNAAETSDETADATDTTEVPPELTQRPSADDSIDKPDKYMENAL